MSYPKNHMSNKSHPGGVMGILFDDIKKAVKKNPVKASKKNNNKKSMATMSAKNHTMVSIRKSSGQ